MNYDWNWTTFADLSPDGVHTYLQTLLNGTIWTITLTLCAFAFALLLGSAVGVMRTVDSRIAGGFAAAYVELFRNVPLIVQMFIWYFVLPELLPKVWGTAVKQMQQPWGQFIPAVLCLGFYEAARVAETIRSGIRSLRAGQRSAAFALGLSPIQTYRYVILPQAIRVVVPPLTSEFMGTMKASSVAMTIGLLELTGAARSMQEFTFHIFEAFGAATLIYLALNSVLVCVLALIERRSTVLRSSARPVRALPMTDAEQS